MRGLSSLKCRTSHKFSYLKEHIDLFQIIKLLLVMLKKLLLYSIFSFSILFFVPTVSAFSGSGAGTSGNPYLIRSCDQFLEIANSLSSNYKQANDIDCTGVSFTSISGGFSGTLDGNNYATNNITITGRGFFTTTNNAVIRNVRLVSGSVTNSGSQAGSLIGGSSGNLTISHTSSALNINSTGDAGGFIGRLNEATGKVILIEKCSYTGNITTSNFGIAGGLIGYAAVGSSSTIPNVTIQDCYTSGTYTTDYIIGGIIGYSSSNPESTEVVEVINSYSTMSGVGSGASFAGGLIGYFPWGGISNSFAAPTFSGTITNKGAVAGYADTSKAQVSGMYFDTFSAGTSNCAGTGSVLTCTAVNSGNSTPAYFQSNSTNAPMSSWNFTDIWQVNSGAYPILRGFTSPAPINADSSTSSTSVSNGVLAPIDSTTPGECRDSTPTFIPNLFEIDTAGTFATLSFTAAKDNVSGYDINFGFNQSANNFGDKMNSNEGWLIHQTIWMLPKNTEMFFKVRAVNGCTAGEWSNVMKVKTGGSKLTQFFPN